MSIDPHTPPTEPWAAADWIMARHEWARSLVAELTPGGVDNEDWLDAVVEAVQGLDPYTAAWQEYEAKHRRQLDQMNDVEYEAWREAGPPASPAVQRLATMSGGELRMVRLIATLHPAQRAPWSLTDLNFDGRGIAFFMDWVKVALSAMSYNPAAQLALRAVVDADRHR